MFAQATFTRVLEAATLNSPSQSPALEEIGMHFVPTLGVRVMTGLLDEGTDGPVFPGQNRGKLDTELEPHNKFHILI